MASTYSFDVTSNIDMPEVDNAVNQARKEIAQRFDFKGSSAAIDLDAKANTLTLTAEDNFKLESVWDVLQTRLIKRSVPVKNMKREDIQPAAGSTVKQVITLQQGIPSDAAKEIVKHLKDLKLKKVQAQIQADQVRVTSLVEGRTAGRHAGAARQGLRGVPPVWQLPLARAPRAGTSPLERAVSKLGLASRTQARALIAAGRVTVDGVRVTHPGHAGRARAGAPSPSTARPRARRGPLTIVLHKPRGVRHDAIGSGRPQDRVRPARRCPGAGHAGRPARPRDQRAADPHQRHAIRRLADRSRNRACRASTWSPSKGRVDEAAIDTLQRGIRVDGERLTAAAAVDPQDLGA